MSDVCGFPMRDECWRHEWQPIETAPRNGSWILVWWPSVTDVAFVGYMVNGEWRAATDGSRWPSLSAPTHWMPLPRPPTQSTEAQK